MMGKISLQELSNVLIERHKLEKRDAAIFVSAIFDIIQTSLEQDRIVKVKGLGTFKIIDVDDRESVNVNTGERMLIEGHNKITFAPDSLMKELVNKPFSQFDTVVLNDGVEIPEASDTEEDGELMADDADEDEVDADVTVRPTSQPAQKVYEDADHFNPFAKPGQSSTASYEQIDDEDIPEWVIEPEPASQPRQSYQPAQAASQPRQPYQPYQQPDAASQPRQPYQPVQADSQPRQPYQPYQQPDAASQPRQPYQPYQQPDAASQPRQPYQPDPAPQPRQSYQQPAPAPQPRQSYQQPDPATQTRQSYQSYQQPAPASQPRQPYQPDPAPQPRRYWRPEPMDEQEQEPMVQAQPSGGRTVQPEVDPAPQSQPQSRRFWQADPMSASEQQVQPQPVANNPMEEDYQNEQPMEEEKPKTKVKQKKSGGKSGLLAFLLLIIGLIGGYFLGSVYPYTSLLGDAEQPAPVPAAVKDEPIVEYGEPEESPEAAEPIESETPVASDGENVAAEPMGDNPAAEPQEGNATEETQAAAPAPKAAAPAPKAAAPVPKAPALAPKAAAPASKAAAPAPKAAAPAPKAATPAPKAAAPAPKAAAAKPKAAAPQPKAAVTYRVAGTDKVVRVGEGDNVTKIARRFLGPGMESYVASYNGISVSTKLEVGREIRIPKLEKVNK